tara:strand:+ start:1644 stop:2063 length:420 start_codon:yes stop_codon:yes gene_type:complete
LCQALVTTYGINSDYIEARTMRTPWDYMHEAMEAKSFSTLNQLSRHLRINRQTAYSWAKGRFVPSEDYLITMAKMIGADPRIALLERQCWISAIDRDKQKLTMWMQILKTLTGELPELPEAYNYEMKTQYKFRTPDFLV